MGYWRTNLVDVNQNDFVRGSEIDFVLWVNDSGNVLDDIVPLESAMVADRWADGIL